MLKLAFLFPGQGSQVVGMGKALVEAFPEARAVFDRADEALGERLSGLCFEGPEEELKRTANQQPAILMVSSAVHAVVASRLPAPAFVAGHSLGEYSAYVAAGAFSLEDGVRAVRARGGFMQDAVPEGLGAMAAVLGLEADRVRDVCTEVAAAAGEKAGSPRVVAPANFNSPEQTVIAGHADAVEQAAEALKTAGAKRVQPLPVSAPFHCALMAPVADRLRPVLEGMTLTAPRVPVVTNVEASPNGAADRIVSLLLEQITAPVRWVESVRALVDLGVDTVVELGPGKVLGGLTKRIDRSLKILNVDSPEALEKALEQLGGA